MELWRLFAHSHWFTLSLIDKKIRICARCTGYVAGFTLLYMLQQIFRLDFLRTTSTWTLYLSIVLLIPLVFDWLTQSWGLRESVNGIRFITGLLFGFALFLFLNSSILHGRDIMIISAFFIAAVGLLGKINRSCCCNV
jgi:uncharacterized membrane protein